MSPLTHREAAPRRSALSLNHIPRNGQIQSHQCLFFSEARADGRVIGTSVMVSVHGNACLLSDGRS